MFKEILHKLFKNGTEDVILKIMDKGPIIKKKFVKPIMSNGTKKRGRFIQTEASYSS